MKDLEQVKNEFFKEEGAALARHPNDHSCSQMELVLQGEINAVDSVRELHHTKDRGLN